MSNEIKCNKLHLTTVKGLYGKRLMMKIKTTLVPKKMPEDLSTCFSSFGSKETLGLST